MATKKIEAPVVLSTDEVRAGVTGHHVRYVLAFGLLGSLIAFSDHRPLLRPWWADAGDCRVVRRRGTARAAACRDRGSIGVCCGRDRTYARPVEHGLGTERDHQPSADALARRPAIHRALPGDGRSISLGQVGGRLGGAGKRQASCVVLVAPP